MKNFLLKMVLVMVFVVLFLSPTHMVNVYVSSTAKEETSCGSTEDDPCRTIQAAVNVAKPHNDITIIASDTPYECPIVVNMPLTFKGIRGTPVIDCEGSHNAFKIQFGKKIMKKQTILVVKMSSLKIQNAKTAIFFGMKIKNANFQISNMTFEGNDIDVNMKNADPCHLTMKDVVAKGSSGDGIQLQSCRTVKVMLKNTRFYGKYFNVVSTNTVLDIKMETVTFDMRTRSNASKMTRSSVHIETADTTSISVQGSQFLNHAGKQHGSVSIISPKPGQPKVPFTLVFKAVTFANNSVSAGNGSAFSYGCTGSQNVIAARVTFDNCVFRGNSAFFRGGAVWFEKINAVDFTGCYFHGNRANGVGKGQGGAIFSTVSRLAVKKCRFYGNSASKSGGTLQVVGVGYTSIADTIFQNDRGSRKNGILGDVMYVNKNRLLMDNVTFDLVSGNSQKPIFWFRSAQTILQMRNSTRFICPTGYHYEELDTIDIRHGTYHFFAFTCSPCPDQFYSVSRGYHLVNGSDVPGKCKLCPNGASCDGTIRARENFWGVRRGDEIEMVTCPRGYCCQREPCDGHDSCASHRTGTLCGRCEKGFSEGISSATCQPNSSCRSWYMVILIICVAVLTSSLLFQQELIDRLTKFLRVKSKKNRTKVDAGEDDEDEHDANGGNADEDDGELSRILSQSYNRVQESKEYNNTMGYVKAFIYFYQVMELLRVSSYASRSSFSNAVIELLMPFLNLQFSDVFTADCLFENITPVTKTLFKNSVCFFLFFILFLSYLVYRLMRGYKFRGPSVAPDTSPTSGSKSYLVRLTGAIMQIILLSYVALTQLTFNLLNCVKVGNHHVLQIDGSVVCYQAFQGFFWFYLVAYIILFPFMLIFGRKRLVSGQLSPRTFILACLFPMFFFAYWGYRKLRPSGPDAATGTDFHRDKILYILQHCYKKSVSANNSMWSTENMAANMAENWESVLVFRRLILVLAFIFAESFLLRSFLLLIFSFVFLIHHFWVKPFVNAKANMFETISLSTLMLFSAFSVAHASFSTAGVVPPQIVVTASAIEDYFIALLPIILLLVIFRRRITHYFGKRCRNNISRSTSFERLHEVQT